MRYKIVIDRVLLVSLAVCIYLYIIIRFQLFRMERKIGEKKTDEELGLSIKWKSGFFVNKSTTLYHN